MTTDLTVVKSVKDVKDYERISDKVDRLDAYCPKCANNGKQRKVFQGYSHCWNHLSRSNRALTQRQNTLKTAGRYGFYIRKVSDAIKLLRNEAEMLGESEDLSSTNIGPELVLSRLLVTDWLDKNKDGNVPLRDITDILHTITKIAKLSKDISDSDRNAVKQDVLRAIVTVVSHAFHKANLLGQPDERAKVFALEIAKLFAGEQIRPAANNADDDNVDIEGTVVGTPGS